MSADLLMRTAGVLASATTLSLLTTIAAYAAVSVAPLKWDGSFCTAKDCAAAIVVLPSTPSALMQIAEMAKKQS